MAPEDVLKKIDNENIFMYLWRRLSALFSPVSPEFIKTRLNCYGMILEHFQNEIFVTTLRQYLQRHMN